MLKTAKNAVGEYISRISCPEGPLFPSGALKSCIMSKFCHSFMVPPFARRRGRRTASVVVLGSAERCGSGRIEALWSPFTWRCKREPAWRRAGKVRAAPPSRGGASAVGSNPQVQASCGPSTGASAVWLIRRREYLGPIRGCKCCGSSFIGALALRSPFTWRRRRRARPLC